MLHFYGTLNLLTGTEVAQPEPLMNSEATARHLEKLLDTYPAVPLLLLRLEVMFFPTATPDLNPQEHVWKAVRSAISHNHDETQLTTLAKRFEEHLTSTAFAYSFLEKFDYVNLCDRFK
jgi:hypothetical protein